MHDEERQQPIQFWRLPQNDHRLARFSRHASMFRLNKITLAIIRHIAFTLLKYEKGHRNFLRAIEFISGLFGAWSMGNVLDAIYHKNPPDDPTKPSLAIGAVIAALFAYASSKVHADWNASFEGLEMLIKFLDYLIDGSPDLTDDECYEWIQALIDEILAADGANYPDFGQIIALKFQKQQGEISTKEFIVNVRVLIHDYYFKRVVRKIEKTLNQNITPENFYSDTRKLITEFVAERDFSRNIEEHIIAPIFSLISSKQNNQINETQFRAEIIRQLETFKQVAGVETAATQDIQHVVHAPHPWHRRAVKWLPFVLLAGLDFGDHTMTNAQTFILPLNTFKEMNPFVRRILILGIFGGFLLATPGDWRACLTTMRRPDSNSAAPEADDAEGNKIDVWVVTAFAGGVLAVSVATFQNFSALTDTLTRAPESAQTFLFNSTTKEGAGIGFAAAGVFGLYGYMFGQTCVNLVSSQGVQSYIINPVRLNVLGWGIQLSASMASNVARAEIYRSEMFETLEQIIRNFLTLPAEVFLLLGGLFVMMMAVVPECRGDYEAIGACLSRFKCFQESIADKIPRFGLFTRPDITEPANQKQEEALEFDVENDDDGTNDEQALLGFMSRVPPSTLQAMRTSGKGSRK